MPESAGASPSSKASERTPDPAQQAAISHTAGPARVFAGPGSGKTFVIVERIRSLVRQGVEPSHILVITFTKAAALEMQERFFRLTEPDRPPVRFGTFHAVFYHILRQSPQYRGYTVITESEKRKRIRQILRLHNRFACVREEDLGEIVSCMDGCLQGRSLPALPLRELRQEDIVFLAKEYESCLAECRQTDFDGITRHCRSVLTQDAGALGQWQAQFRHILIDEFQDISPEQYEMIRLLAAPEHNLFIVGDDDQSVYGFRGASPDSMQMFLRDYPEAATVFLNTNYRCGRQIVDAAGRVIGENRRRMPKGIRAVHERGEGLRLHLCGSEEEQCRELLSLLAAKKQAGRLADCAVICRTNYDCAVWAQRFRGAGLPYTMKEKAQNPYDHFVVRDLMAYLTLADGVRERRYFLRIMNRPVRYLKRDCVSAASAAPEGITEKKLLAYYADAPGIRKSVRRLFDDLDAMKGRKPHLQIHYVRRVIGYDRYLTDKYGAEKAKEYLGVAQAFQELASGFHSLWQLDDYISQYEDAIPRGGKGTDTDTAERGLSLLTMHGSKGLEFETVILPDCQDGRLPSPKAATPEEIEEERRMFYVAMTRAKQELHIAAYYGKSGKDMPSRFLKCLLE